MGRKPTDVVTKVRIEFLEALELTQGSPPFLEWSDDAVLTRVPLCEPLPNMVFPLFGPSAGPLSCER